MYRWRIMSLFACMIIPADTRSRPFSSVHFLYVNSRGVHQKSQTDRTGLCKQVLSHNCLNSKLMMMTVFCRIGSARSRIKTVPSILRCHCGSLTTPKLFYLHGLPNRQSHLKPEPLRHNGLHNSVLGKHTWRSPREDQPCNAVRSCLGTLKVIEAPRCLVKSLHSSEFKVSRIALLQLGLIDVLLMHWTSLYLIRYWDDLAVIFWPNVQCQFMFTFPCIIMQKHQETEGLLIQP